MSGDTKTGFSRTFADEAPILTDRGQSPRLFPAHDAGLQQGKPRTAVHLPFDRLQSIHVTFHRAVAPSRCHRRVHRRLVAANAFGKVADLRACTHFGPRQPLRQPAGCLLTDQCSEVVRKVQGGCQIGLAPRILSRRLWASAVRFSGRRIQSNESCSGEGGGAGLGFAAFTRDAPCRPVPGAW